MLVKTCFCCCTSLVDLLVQVATAFFPIDSVPIRTNPKIGSRMGGELGKREKLEEKNCNENLFEPYWCANVRNPFRRMSK